MAPRESTIINTFENIKTDLENNHNGRALKKVTTILGKFSDKGSATEKPPSEYNRFVKKEFEKMKNESLSASEKMSKAAENWKKTKQSA